MQLIYSSHFRAPDGKLHVQGLLPGQSVYQTADGKLGLTGTPIRPLQPNKPVTSLPTPSTPQSSSVGITPQNTGQTILIQSSDSGQLQSGAASSTTPLINISSPAMRTVLAGSTSTGAGVGVGNAIKLLSTSTSTPTTPQQIHTYSKNIRKVNPKLPGTPTAIAPATSGHLTGTLNSAGQIVLTRGGQVINSQIVIGGGATTPGQGSSPGTIVVSSGSGIQSASPGIVQTSSGTIQIASSPAPGMAIASHQPGGRVVIQDGNKTIVVTGGSNLTPAQLQQILALNVKKTGMSTPGKPQHIQIQQVGKPGGVQQQIAIQPSPQGQMQVIQQAGGQGQVQIISGGQNIQQIAAGGKRETFKVRYVRN